MLAFRSFLDLVEIRTKAASMLPFALGTVYAMLRFGEFSLLHFALMLISLLSFELVVTAKRSSCNAYAPAPKHPGLHARTVQAADLRTRGQNFVLLTGVLVAVIVIAAWIVH
ncbi:hypothetical protein [Saccharibacillus deserti]|uniref:hypothetical protein n=1 Tax=Saccharibacillus deserti TaxID=1634444 RepID=UPI0015550BEB|nr:hypothetical protein [Saccharibacillus deserti]